MPTEADVVALFERANPVPDLDVIDIAVTADQRLGPEQPAEGATLFCTYETLDAVVVAVDGEPIPTSTYFTVVDDELSVIDQRYGLPDFATLGTPFTRWMEENHPEVTGALFHGWTTREEAVEHGRLRAEWAQAWATSLTDESGAATAAEPQPVVPAPALGAPVDGETQQSVVGDITWTRLEGDITTLPSDVSLVHDGTFYGTGLSNGGDQQSEPQPQWFTSPDGVTWTAWEQAPRNTDLTAVGGTLWAESFQFAPGTLQSSATGMGRTSSPSRSQLRTTCRVKD